MSIPKKLSHIWIGNLPAPRKWMESWKKHHPEWSYTLYDNKFLSSHNFKTKNQINEYIKRGQYAGAADLMRLEILYEHGGFMPGADSICLMNTDVLFTKECAYTVYENELVRGELVSPIQACQPGNKFILEMIHELSNTPPELLDEPWISTGNLFTTQAIKKASPEIVIFPSHYLIPVHFTGVSYAGEGPVFAKQMFGTTQGLYKEKNPIKIILNIAKKALEIQYKRMRRHAAFKRRIQKLESY